MKHFTVDLKITAMSSYHEPLRYRLIQLFKDIESGAVSIRRLNSGAPVHVDYETDNGWKLRVFNDCGYWDYLERAEDHLGQVLNFDEIHPLKDVVDWLEGSPIWGIRGHDDPDSNDQDLGKWLTHANPTT